MTSAFEHGFAPLDQTFRCETSTRSYTVKWCSLGEPTSPPLVFIHGTPWSSRVWVPFALALSRQFRVYLYDRPGFGESPSELKAPGIAAAESNVVEYDGNLARQSEVFAALFKTWAADWGGRKAHVVAHDNAGLISLRAHLLHGCPYASLCLINVVAIGPFGQHLFKTIGDSPGHFTKLPDMAVEGILETYIRNAAFRPLTPEAMDMLKAPWLREGGKEGFIRELCQANARSTEEVEGRYGEVGKKMPVKVIWGKEDNWIPVADAWRLGKALGAREVVEVEGAGHLVMFDQGGQLGVELGTWLSEVSKKA